MSVGYRVEERAMDSSCACAPLRKPPPGLVAEAKLRMPMVGAGACGELPLCVAARRRAPSSVEISRMDIRGWSHSVGCGEEDREFHVDRTESGA